MPILVGASVSRREDLTLTLVGCCRTEALRSLLVVVLKSFRVQLLLRRVTMAVRKAVGDSRCSAAVWVEQVAFELRNIFAVALA